MEAARWERLVASLAAAGIDAKVDFNGLARSICIRLEDHFVHIGDKYWRKNADIWIGWQVCTEGRRDSIVQRIWPLTKKRSEVVAAVLEAVASLTPAA